MGRLEVWIMLVTGVNGSVMPRIRQQEPMTYRQTEVQNITCREKIDYLSYDVPIQ